MKTCSYCKETKPADAFHIRRKSPDGLALSCKECKTQKGREYRASSAGIATRRLNQAKAVASGRKAASRKRYNSSEKGLAQLRAQSARYRVSNPEKVKARSALNHAIRDGKLKRQPCEVCGATCGVHAHHHDYGRPLDVTWLCAQHHMDTHYQETRA